MLNVAYLRKLKVRGRTYTANEILFTRLSFSVWLRSRN